MLIRSALALGSVWFWGALGVGRRSPVPLCKICSVRSITVPCSDPSGDSNRGNLADEVMLGHRSQFPDAERWSALA